MQRLYPQRYSSQESDQENIPFAFRFFRWTGKAQLFDPHAPLGLEMRREGAGPNANLRTASADVFIAPNPRNASGLCHWQHGRQLLAGVPFRLNAIEGGYIYMHIKLHTKDFVGLSLLCCPSNLAFHGFWGMTVSQGCWHGYPREYKSYILVDQTNI